MVEAEALRGFRFVDRAQRAGIRAGAACACRGRGCARVPDVRGVVRLPELWHASSFDWLTACAYECPDGSPYPAQYDSRGGSPTEQGGAHEPPPRAAKVARIDLLEDMLGVQ